MLDKHQAQTLLSLARQSIEKQLGVPPASPVHPDELQNPALNQKQPVFITLKKLGRLRGCIGSLTGEDTIISGVIKNSVNAAFHDSRFPDLERGELEDLEIEISVLSELKPLVCKDGDELIAKLRPGIDGVRLKADNGRGATFLPQVWSQLPDPIMFMAQLCLKAGLPETAWTSGELEISTYQVQKFR